MQKYNKFWVALVGGLLSWWSSYSATSYNHWLPLVLSLLTAAGVIGVPNITPPAPPAA